MNKEFVQKLADGENIAINDDMEYFAVELTRWLRSLCHAFGIGESFIGIAGGNKDALNGEKGCKDE
ncbi:MAG: hypothetical protein FWE84_01365 [Firmicutes bacterium]|nr:hypothetical protein [Bacillota bacterium]